MAAVKNKNTKPEILLRKALFNKGFRYRINYKHLPGSPDIVLPKYRTVIFVHGCFWHGHTDCKKQINPNSNQDFWNTKIQINRVRDQKVMDDFLQLDWEVIVIWECELRNMESFDDTIDRVIFKINSNK